MVAQRTPEPLLERVASMRRAGPASARQLAETIIRDPLFASRSGILALAEASGTSVGSVNRFCRSLGLPGYTALRLALAATGGDDSRGDMHEVDPTGSIGPATSAHDAVQMIATSSQAAIGLTAELLDLERLDRLAQAVDEARLVQLVAFGGSAYVASYLMDQFIGIGVTTLTSTDVNTAASIAAGLTREDVLVAISHSGAARHTVEVTQIGSDHGALTAAVTSSALSPLAEAARIPLATTARTSTARYRGTAGRHAQLFVTDALYVRVAQRRHTEAERLLDRAGAATEPYQLTYKPGVNGSDNKTNTKQSPQE